jgi:hypothetical protein
MRVFFIMVIALFLLAQTSFGKKYVQIYSKKTQDYVQTLLQSEKPVNKIEAKPMHSYQSQAPVEKSEPTTFDQELNPKNDFGFHGTTMPSYQRKY